MRHAIGAVGLAVLTAAGPALARELPRADPPSALALLTASPTHWLPGFALGEVAAPPAERGVVWRVCGTAGGAALMASVAFGLTIFGLSKVPNNSTQARDDTVPLVLASAGGALVGGVAGYFLGRLGDDGSLAAKIGSVALAVVGGLAAVVMVSAIAGGAFTLR